KRLRRQLDAQQSDFEKTGGIHASALFDTNGDFLVAYEDVGRHNALDKLVGHHFLESKTKLSDRILLLSGRASFELIQKAASVRLKIVCAIGAPSSLAVDLAQEFNMTLIGFLKDSSFNIYSTPERVIF
ncbi:MAG: formate dehydrogenase accessory sulfurtransferase FdhD, partial [Chitinophagales bacterium]